MARMLLALPLLIALGCGPMVMIPGGELSGEVKPTPSDWSFSDDVETVQLETNPDDPYSVNVWGVSAGPHFYIAAGRKTNQCAENLRMDPHARLRIGDDIFEVQAVEVVEEAELDTFLAAAQQKYDFEPEPDQRAEAALFRLGPR